MQFTKTAIAAIMAATSVSAAPTIAARNTPSPDPNWSITNIQRGCDGDASCTWTFNVNANIGGVDAIDCSYTTYSDGTNPASKSSGGPSDCGRYTITSGYNFQYAFTTLAVKDQGRGRITFPSPTDSEVQDGRSTSRSEIAYYL